MCGIECVVVKIRESVQDKVPENVLSCDLHNVKLLAVSDSVPWHGMMYVI